MGLCDEERFEGAVRVVNELTELSDQLHKTMLHDSKLAQLVDELWPALLSRSGSASFWLTGSALNSEYIDGKSLWGVALQEGVEPEEAERFDDGIVEYLYRYTPTIDKIADGGYSGLRTSLVIQVYAAVEAGFYYINRYPNDEFAKAVSPLADLFARIHGECYRQMSGNESFLEAHYRNQLIKKALPYLDVDFVSTWWRQHNLHHDIRNDRGIPVEELGRLWAEVQGKDKLPPEKRLLITLTLVGRSYHYEHQHKERLEMLQKHNKKAKKTDQISIAKVKKALARCRALKVEYDERGQQNYDDGQYCVVTSKIRRRQEDEAYNAEQAKFFKKAKKAKKARRPRRAKENPDGH